MKRIYSFTALLLAILFFSNPSAAFGPGPGPGPGPKPGGIPMNIGFGAKPGQLPGLLEGAAIQNIQDKICLAKTTNTIKYCINNCPQVDPQSTTSLSSAECIVECIGNFTASIQKCL